MKRKGLYQNGVVPASKILRSYKSGDSLSFKSLNPDKDKNPPFDPRARRTPNVAGMASHGLQGLLRGRIIQYRQEVYSMRPGGPLLQRGVNFLYNPEQIAVNYSFDPSMYPSESQQTKYPVPVLGATGQTVSWTLYFNRMYEVASDSRQENMGVLADVQAIEYLLGSKDGVTQSMVECMVVFGSTPRQKPFAYIGFLSDINVTYTHFSRRMIPTVAKVEVGMVRRFISNEVMTSAPPAVDIGGTAANDRANGGQTSGWGSNGGPRSGAPRVQDPTGGGGGIPVG